MHLIFVETPAFCRWREENLDDEAFRALQNVLIANPQVGDLIPGTGGLRKLRVGLQGRGKRGGARVIYYWWASEEQVYLLSAFAKNKRVDLTPRQRELLADAMHREVAYE